MKFITVVLVFILVAFSSKNTFAQSKGYGQIGPTLFVNNDMGNRMGISASGGGFVGGISSVGAGVDYYLNQKDPMGMLYGDFRFYFQKVSKGSAPFIAFQPGGVLYSKTYATKTTKGSFGCNALAGFFVKSKKGIGGALQIGFTYLSFKEQEVTKQYPGLKGTVAVYF